MATRSTPLQLKPAQTEAADFKVSRTTIRTFSAFFLASNVFLDDSVRLINAKDIEETAYNRPDRVREQEGAHRRVFSPQSGSRNRL